MWLKSIRTFWKILKKRVFQIELRILESCSFDYRVNNYVHIDEYVIKIGRELSFDYKLCNLAWVIAYDALKLETILVIPQHSIALAILKIAYELLDNKNWSSKRYSLFETDEKSVNEAYFDIVNFLHQFIRYVRSTTSFTG